MDLKNTGYDVAYDHIGIPTIHPSEGEVYQADISAHVYRVGTDALRIEKIRFDSDAPFPQDVKTRSHIAFKVDDLAEAIFGKQIVMPPTEFKPGIQFAFVDIEGALIEFFQIG